MLRAVPSACTAGDATSAGAHVTPGHIAAPTRAGRRCARCSASAFVATLARATLLASTARLAATARLRLACCTTAVGASAHL